MSWISYHCHSDLCDGVERPLASVLAARSRGMIALGFSAHAPLPFPRPWCLGRGLDVSSLARYKAEIENLKRLYGGSLQLWAGLEVDYIPGLVGPSDPIFADFDYRLGSIHFVGRTREGGPWQLDDCPESFASGLLELYGGDVRALVEAYYGALCDMVRFDAPDIVAHFDLVKKYNRGSRFFDEGSSWYRELVDGALRAIAAEGLILELNTGGLARGWTEECYPGPWALGRCRELGIAMTLGADSHAAATVDFGLDQAAAALARAGYEELMVLGGDGWLPLAFDERGLSIRGAGRAA
jgi:histidinol-phosphatase (PHP family)